MVGKGRQQKNNAVKNKQKNSQLFSGQNPEHTDHEKESHSGPDRKQQHGIVDVRHGFSKDLQIRLRYRDRKAQEKAGDQNKGQIFAFGQRCADFHADRRHGLLSAQGKQAHADHHQQCAHKERQHQIRCHRTKRQTEQRHNDENGKDRLNSLTHLFFNGCSNILKGSALDTDRLLRF